MLMHVLVLAEAQSIKAGDKLLGERFAFCIVVDGRVPFKFACITFAAPPLADTARQACQATQGKTSGVLRTISPKL